MAFNGIPWNSMEVHGIRWNSMELHGILWDSMEYHGIPWNSMEVHGIVRESIEFYGTPWIDMHGIQIRIVLSVFSFYACALHSSQMFNRFREESDLFLTGPLLDSGLS